MPSKHSSSSNTQQSWTRSKWKKEELQAITEAQHAGLQERDLLHKAQQIELFEKLMQLKNQAKSEAVATSAKHIRSSRNQHKNRTNNRKGKAAKHKDGSIGSNTTSPTTNQSKHKEVPVVYDWDTDWDGTPVQKTRNPDLKPP